MPEKPIINCHTHVFTGDHVPPFLAKTYLPWPVYYLLHLRAFVFLCRLWYKYPARIPYTFAYKKFIKALTQVRAFFLALYPLNVLFSLYIGLVTLYFLYSLFQPIFPPKEGSASGKINDVFLLLAPILPAIEATWLKIALVLLVLAFFSTIRHFVLILAKFLFKGLAKLLDPRTRDLAKRYLNIGRYAFHRKQRTIFSKLRDQYPRDTGFIVLPMDMEYMEAGKSKTRYRDQMAELAEIKSNNKEGFYPFVFVDPRRIVPAEQELNHKVGDKTFFECEIGRGVVTLKDCFMRDFLETHRFSGIKIYPALGYYPFDEKLLPLWKYCSDHHIPLLTHCIKGTIYYRGRKKEAWNSHPLFRQAMAKASPTKDHDGFYRAEEAEMEEITQYAPLVLPQFKNVDFSYNFTHPMNYLCLLEEELLRKLIMEAIRKDPKTKLGELFGYNGPDKRMDHDLRNLKICLGHFGGDDEWKRYYELDRYNYSSQLVKNPETGIRFFHTVNNEPAPGKPEQLWKHTDWYSIICSMMLQYPQVYADISYILHSDADILPLLKQTLQNPGLRSKVLYGTDFFVVRNHKSEKHMLADMMGGLSACDFDQIARTNPQAFLHNTLPDSNLGNAVLI